MLLWISIWISLDFYGYPCIDLLWILDPGMTAACDSDSFREVSCIRLIGSAGRYSKVLKKILT